MNKRKMIFAVMILPLLFIYLNSLLPISVSGGMSDRIADFMRQFPFLAFITGNMVRKLAHAVEFGVFGIVTAVFLRTELKNRLPLIAFGGLLTAVIDETIQLFSEGRGSRVTDIWIDFAGFSAGIVVVYLVIKIKNQGGN